MSRLQNYSIFLIRQEYPPGVKLVPMRSRTAKPFHTTNLVVFVPGTSYDGFGGGNFVASGDALIIDPGCNSAMHKEVSCLILDREVKKVKSNFVDAPYFLFMCAVCLSKWLY